MIKRPMNRPFPVGRAPKINPPARPDWYKRFRQLASLANKTFRVK